MFGINPSKEQIRSVAENVDLSNEDVQEALLKVGEDRIRPQLDEIKERAEAADDPESVRAELEALSDERKTEIFHETFGEFIVACTELRIAPVEGMRHLKTMIRDPWTLEVMLLMLEVDEMPDEIEQANKDLIAQYVTWIGRAVAPEMYQREHVEDMVEEFGANPELLDKWDENNIPDDV